VGRGRFSPASRVRGFPRETPSDPRRSHNRPTPYEKEPPSSSRLGHRSRRRASLGLANATPHDSTSPRFALSQGEYTLQFASRKPTTTPDSFPASGVQRTPRPTEGDSHLPPICRLAPLPHWYSPTRRSTATYFAAPVGPGAARPHSTIRVAQEERTDSEGCHPLFVRKRLVDSSVIPENHGGYRRPPPRRASPTSSPLRSRIASRPPTLSL